MGRLLKKNDLSVHSFDEIGHWSPEIVPAYLHEYICILTIAIHGYSKCFFGLSVLITTNYIYDENR